MFVVSIPDVPRFCGWARSVLSQSPLPPPARPPCLRWIVRDNDPSNGSKAAEKAEKQLGLTVRARFLGGRVCVADPGSVL